MRESLADEERKRAEDEARAVAADKLAAEEAAREKARLEKLARKEAKEKVR